MGFLQSQGAPLFEKDMTQLSKIEKGLLQLKREQIPIIAKLFIASQICAIVKDEKLANEVILMAEEKSKQKNRCKSFIK